ncbi:MAG: hypothetical protein J0H98_06690 [Solirubrobacterales bacterium]|nr:hypothetical protein [Solirubrobacterales bacterium]
MTESTEPKIRHANQLRSQKFNELLGKRKTWFWILGFAVPLGLLFGIKGAWFVGLPIAALIVIFGVLVAFWIADNRAEDAFYDAYCEAHGLTRIEDPDLGELTPLLRKGDERKTKEMFAGELAPGIEGNLALFTYTVVTHDAKGNRHESDYPFTLVQIPLPETVAHLPELRVQGQSGFKFLEKFEDAFRADHERVTLESEAMRDRYEVFVLKDQDPIWVRRLFSPSFIVWLTENPPYSFAFELENGQLVAYVKRHADEVEEFDQVVRVGTYVAARLREEATQTSAVD